DAAGSSEEGGGTGGDAEITADGDIVVNGKMILSGGQPDGEGGTFFVQAGGSFTDTAVVNMLGPGIDACGGEMDVSAGRDVSLDHIIVDGGSCGAGNLSFMALGTLTIGNVISADGSTGISTGGFMDLNARDVLVNAVIHATGGSQSPGGQITIEACNLTVPQASQIGTTGGMGFAGFGNIFKVSGKATISGKLMTTSPSTNTIIYRDPTMPPSITGTVTP